MTMNQSPSNNVDNGPDPVTQNDRSVGRSSVIGALTCLALSMLMSSLGISIANVALPRLTEVFDVSFPAVQWIVIAYLLAITVMIVGVGRLGDIVGRRQVLLVGIAIFSTASALCGMAPTLWFLIGARALQGVGAAILMVLAMALVRETVPSAKTGSAMGLLGTMSAIGTALGPSLGGVLVAGPGWRLIFLILVPVGLLNFALTIRYVPRGLQRNHAGDHGCGVKRDFDFAGMVTLGLALGAYALSVTLGRQDFGRNNILLLFAAGVLGAVFVVGQLRAKSPLVRFSVLREAGIIPNLVMNVVVATVMMTTLVIGPFYLAGALGLNEALVGAVLSAGPVISACTGFPSGRLVDRFGARGVMLGGLILMVGGTVALSVIPIGLGVVGYIGAIVILTPGYQLFQAANNTSVMKHIDADQRGVISGILSLSRNLGLITGASVMGAIFTFALGSRDFAKASAVEIARGMHGTFLLAAILVAGATFIAACLYLRSARLQYRGNGS